MRPQDALAAAIAEAERRRAAGGYVEPEGGTVIAPTDQVTRAQLLEWALLEPDLTKLRSTRRAGAPITWLKRMLLRGMQQYLNELTYQQSRFNIQILRRLMELEDRVEQLEDRDGGTKP